MEHLNHRRMIPVGRAIRPKCYNFLTLKGLSYCFAGRISPPLKQKDGDIYHMAQKFVKRIYKDSKFRGFG